MSRFLFIGVFVPVFNCLVFVECFKGMSNRGLQILKSLGFSILNVEIKCDENLLHSS